MTRSTPGRGEGKGAAASACGSPIPCRRALPRLLALAALLLAATVPHPAAAQQAPAISIASSITIEAPSQSALTISVGPADRIPRNSFIRLRGLPPTAALSEGHSIAPGAWAIALSALRDLKLTMPASAPSRMEILVALVAIDGTVLAEARSTLLVGAPQTPAGAPLSATVLRATPNTAPPPAPGVQKAPVPPRSAVPNMTPEDRERALRLLKRGQDELADANLSSARLFFERAADAGLAEAALALGATYEVAELQRLNIRGVQGDNKEARRWYERAAQLGAPEASQRLQRLGAN